MTPIGPLVYLSSRFLPQDEARLTLHDAGFVWGATVTDLCRTFGRRLFRLPDHLARFRRSCAAARLPPPPPDAELTAVAERLVAHNGALLPAAGDLAVVFFATPGPVGYYLGEPGGPGDGPPTLGVHTFPIPFTRYVRLFREGAVLAVPPTRHVPAACLDPRVKQRSRLHWWVAEQEARGLDPGASALLLDADGCVTETAGANFLLVKDGVVCSPPRAAVLNGVSLQVTEELCRSLGVPFVERPIPRAELAAADEALLTGTAFGLAGVRRLDGADLAWPGPICRRLRDAWDRLAELDIAGQITAAAVQEFRPGGEVRKGGR
jgi:branched-subunit amino acid aminotransferase/4-amino-4-deoxychorismate lyase